MPRLWGSDADDTVICGWGKNNVEVAARLTKVMVDVSDWLNKCCLQLNTSNTVAMFFSKTSRSHTEPDVFISDQRIKIVKEYKYLGILIDNQLTFKKHVKKICKNLKFTLANFRHLRNHMSTEAAKMYMFSLILSHINYSPGLLPTPLPLNKSCLFTNRLSKYLTKNLNHTITVQSSISTDF